MKSPILHVDMDAFFAAVEQRDQPLLRGKPVIVGGRDPTQRGVVSAASYEARAFGVHSAMPLQTARRLCPDGAFLAGDHHKYQVVSQELIKILQSFTPLVEKISIDEAFLDVTGCEDIFGCSKTIAQSIKNAIKKKLDLTASVGVAPNKLLAKMASDLEKPDGLVVVNQEEVDDFLKELPITRLWGVGKKTAQHLNQKGIFTVGDLKGVDPKILKIWFGKTGLELYSRAQGLDPRPVNPIPFQEKSMGHEITFSQDQEAERFLKGALLELSTKVSRRLRKRKKKGRTLTLKVRFSDFTTITRHSTFLEPTHSEFIIYQEAVRLLEGISKVKPVRLLGISMGNLMEISREQLSLFQDSLDREADLMQVVDDLKDRYGEGIIRRGGTFLWPE